MVRKNSLKIALIGTRGVPAKYGGFETCVEEVGRRLAEEGHRVTVYCRNSYYKVKRKSYLGMNLTYLPRKAVEEATNSRSVDPTLSGILFLQFKVRLEQLMP